MVQKPKKSKVINQMTVALLIITGLVVWFLPHEKISTQINIGIPFDSAGIVIQYFLDEKGFNAKIQPVFSTYSIKDCCTSTAEWALSGDRLDMALLCPDAADRLIERDNRYQIIGPVMINSDIIVVHPGIEPQTVGITQNRWYQKELIESAFGPDCRAVPMLSGALPYAYQDNKVDAVVMDIEKALLLKGDYLSTHHDGNDIVTYVLVVRKSFIEDERYKQFLQAFNESVKELTDPVILQKALENYSNYPCEGKEAEKWLKLKVHYQQLTTVDIK